MMRVQTAWIFNLSNETPVQADQGEAAAAEKQGSDGDYRVVCAARICRPLQLPGSFPCTVVGEVS